MKLSQFNTKTVQIESISQLSCTIPKTSRAGQLSLESSRGVPWPLRKIIVNNRLIIVSNRSIIATTKMQSQSIKNQFGEVNDAKARVFSELRNAREIQKL